MSENPAGRKPGQRNESVHDRLIREAQERGGFDNLKGAGKPLRHLTGPGARDWVTQWVQREDLSGVLPPELALRKEAEKIVDTCADLPTEAEVRSVVDELNRRIREMRLRPPSGHYRGPDSFLRTVSADRVVGEWRERRAGR
ncbi:DUF1992 domain-containing protein [Microlunatus endophyticus]|uniref:DUF1992 domain-containing protein n=1 Tax=Microlunatus endophyticus TaxID=1716077 RepID=A0A917W574_9ACTN|nr:DUF1992 domain-containing protein [Microlunatus endophyticus]GGL64084.1 DUF1992 domain-containing protein [Microlunatus endophyticus]